MARLFAIAAFILIIVTAFDNLATAVALAILALFLIGFLKR